MWNNYNGVFLCHWWYIQASAWKQIRRFIQLLSQDLLFAFGNFLIVCFRCSSYSKRFSKASPILLEKKECTTFAFQQEFDIGAFWMKNNCFKFFFIFDPWLKAKYDFLILQSGLGKPLGEKYPSKWILAMGGWLKSRSGWIVAVIFCEYKPLQRQLIINIFANICHYIPS